MTSADLRAWQVMWRSDVYRNTGSATWGGLIRLLLRSRTFRPVFTARLCQAVTPMGVVGRPAGIVFRQAHRWSQHSAGIDFPSETALGPGCVIVHGWGLVVSPDARIGANVTLFHGVTLGRKDHISSDGTRTVGGSPILEDGVWIGPNAAVLGAVTVGTNARIAAGAVVVADVPANSVVGGNPARVLRRDAPPDVPNAWVCAPARAHADVPFSGG